jgi:hypothetical protein
MKEIWKWFKVSTLVFAGIICILGAYCAATNEMTGLCVGMAILVLFWAAVEGILGGI